MRVGKAKLAEHHKAAMKVHHPLVLLLCVVFLVVAEAANGGNKKWQKRRERKLAQKGWYGPVASPDECKAEGRTAKVILKSDMMPSDICADVETEVCLCISGKAKNGKGKNRKNNRKNGRKNKADLQGDEDMFADMDFSHKCAKCQFKWEPKHQGNKGGNGKNSQPEGENDLDEDLDITEA